MYGSASCSLANGITSARAAKGRGGPLSRISVAAFAVFALSACDSVPPTAPSDTPDTNEPLAVTSAEAPKDGRGRGTVFQVVGVELSDPGEARSRTHESGRVRLEIRGARGEGTTSCDRSVCSELDGLNTQVGIGTMQLELRPLRDGLYQAQGRAQGVVGWDTDGDGTYETTTTWEASIKDTVEFMAGEMLLLGELQLGAANLTDGGTGNLKFDIILEGWDEGVAA